MKKIIKYLLLLIFLVPTITLAEENDKYITTSSSDIELKEDFNNTHFVFGDSILVNNKTDGIYFIFGEMVDYQSENEYVALFGNRLTVSGKIKDGALFGNNVRLENALIDRDVVIFGNKVYLSGTFNGNVLVYADTVNVENGTFSKNLTVKASELTVNKETEVSGVLTYDEDMDVSIENENIDRVSITSIKEITTNDKILNYVGSLIRLLLIFLVMYLMIPKVFDKINNNIGKNFGYGAIAFIGLPIVLLILMFTNLATSIAIIGVMLYVIFIMIAKVLVGYVIGKYLYTKVFKLEEKKYLCGILGITIVYLLSIIPYVGGWITFISLIYSFGIITNLYIDSRK